MKTMDCFKTEIEKYKDPGPFGDWIIESLIKQGLLSFKKKKLGLDGILGTTKFYKYSIFWSFGDIAGEFKISVYYGNKGNKYILSQLYRELNKIYENNLYKK